jgi:hypothetical protein
VSVILRAVDNLKTILAFILPHTAQKLHEYIGYDGQLFGTQHLVEYQEETRSHGALTYDQSGAIGTWTKSERPPGQALRPPASLFKSWTSVWWGKGTRGWKDSRAKITKEPGHDPRSFVWGLYHHSDQLIEAVHR